MKIINLEDLETPCLVLDKKLLERNCLKVRNRCLELKTTLRPHVKTSKSVQIIRLALDKKIGPITVSTLQEAEYFASSGFKDILYAVGIVPNKLSRLANIQQKFNCNVRMILDSVQLANNVIDYSNLNNTNFEILIEIDSGEGRGGLRPNDKLIQEISNTLYNCSRTKLMGVLTHAGHSYASNDVSEISSIANKERGDALEAVKNLLNINQPCPIVSVGSTPTMLFSSHLDDISEVRSGIYMFWDLAQASRGICKIEDIAITVLASVVGHNYNKQRIIIDAGALALSKDISANKFMPEAGFGLVCDSNTGIPLSELNVSEVHQEHGTINIKDKKWFNLLPVGSLVRILPNHSCLTCAGFDRYNILENNSINDFWPRTNGW
jgi:D-serine deaminase-like pyridoxal phosphate-dependent protein